MNDLNKNLSYSLWWLSLESITYHAIFIAHQIMLFNATGLKIYGIISVIFSVIYFASTISTFALEASLSPFYEAIISNKKTFKKFFIIQFLPIFFLSLLYIPILIFCKNPEIFYSTLFVTFSKLLPSNPAIKKIFQESITYTFIFTIFITILSESIKKPLRAILYLSLKNKKNMIIEIFSLIIYVASIWSVYFITGKITVNLIFIPLATTSIISSIVLLFFVYKFYIQLPDASCNYKTNSLQYKIFKTRIINFASQFTHSLFSSNFIVPFFAIQFGLAQAAIFKLLSHICYTITMVMRKIFGWTCDTVMAQTKNLKKIQKQQVFHKINNNISNIMLSIIIFLSINLAKIINYTSTPLTIINWPLIYFFLTITLIENLFISYEKFCIAEEKNWIVLIINLIAISSFSLIIFYANKNSQTLILFFITAIRAGLFITLAIISYFKWGIKPKISINSTLFVISILCSILFFKLF